MDASGLLSGLVLAGSLLTFTYTSLRQALASANTNPKTEPQLLALLRLGAAVSMGISGVALLFSLSWMTWPLAAAFSVALLALLILIRLLCGLIASKRPAVALFLTSPLHRLTAGPGGAAPQLQTNGGHSLPQDLESVMASEEHTVLDERERSMIRSILRLGEFNARDIMAPRLDVVAVDLEDNLTAVINRMLVSGHSKLPVYRETIDNVVGVIYSRRLMPLLNTEPPWPPLSELIMEPFFVPETKRLDELLAEFQKRRVQMAIVIDEHGGTEGLVTIEDLLEEIVGEIEDEFSTSTAPQISREDNGNLIVDAGTSLNDLEDLVPLDLHQTDVDTIGGLVYSALGKIPQVGDEVMYKGLRIKVLSTMGRRLTKLLLAPAPVSNNAD